MKNPLLLVLLFCAQLLPVAGWAQRNYPTPVEGDFALPKFRFESGETLPTLTIHYTTIGQPRRDKAGKIVNAVLIMHGTTGRAPIF
ncbi:hypothetical protein [Hymenobacter sp. BRD67]|uniref:hypothetical protein n=1 Tax=Hymenobacter sp. BRD67 TaxID=2675877 RepID=UPI001C25FB02|nr:hypothetical protein [Hymenobacter sp. BRD67]